MVNIFIILNKFFVYAISSLVQKKNEYFITSNISLKQHYFYFETAIENHYFQIEIYALF